MAFVSNTNNRLFKTTDDNNQNVSKNVGMDSAASGGSGSEKAPQDFTKSNSLTGATSAILNRNKLGNEGVKNTLVDPIKQASEKTIGQIGQKQQEYGQELKGATYNTPTYSQQDISSVGTSPTAKANLSSYLNYNFDPESVKQYSNTVESKVYDPSMLRAGNYGASLQAQKAGNYTQGMAALDDVLFSRSLGAQRSLAQAGQGFQQNVDNQIKKGGDVRSEFIANKQNEIAQGKEGLKGQLANQKQNILNTAQAKIPGLQSNAMQQQQEYVQKLAQQQRDATKANAANYAAQVKFQQPLQMDLPGGGTTQIDLPGGPVSDELMSYILGNADPMNYLSGGEVTPEVSLANAISDDDASALNSLNELLGSSDRFKPEQIGQGKINFDKAGYDARIQSIIDELNGKNKGVQIGEIGPIDTSNAGVQFPGNMNVNLDDLFRNIGGF